MCVFWFWFFQDIGAAERGGEEKWERAKKKSLLERGEREGLRVSF